MITKFSINIRNKTLLIFLLIPACWSCTTIKKNNKTAVLLNSVYCHPDVPYKEDTSYISIIDLNTFLKTDTLLVGKYSIHDIRLANAMGLIFLLQELTILGNRHYGQRNIESRVKYLEKRQLIINRLLVAMATVSSIAAELDCEGERADQIASFMDNNEAQTIKRLTALSIGLGAVASIATTILTSGTSYYALGIGGGVGSALFALVTLYPNRKVQYIHSRNMLSDIWFERSNPQHYPPFIWYIFTDTTFKTSENIIAHNLKKGWERFGSIGKTESKQRQKHIELFFGEGGKYTAEDLHARADMINQLQSSVRLINQDLQSLIIALSK